MLTNNEIYQEVQKFAKGYDLNQDGVLTSQEIYYSLLKSKILKNPLQKIIDINKIILTVFIIKF